MFWVNMRLGASSATEGLNPPLVGSGFCHIWVTPLTSARPTWDELATCSSLVRLDVVQHQTVLGIGLSLIAVKALMVLDVHW